MTDPKISIQGSLSKAFMAKKLNITFDRDYYFDLDKRLKTDRLCNDYAATELADLEIFYTESNLGRFQYFSNDQILVGGIQPNMILGMLVGADFVPNDAMDADISPAPLKGKTIEDLPDPQSLLDHELIKLFDTQIESIKADTSLTPIPPFFWDASGRATIHGQLTTAQKFIGENIFMDLITDPEPAAKLLNWITECSIILCEHFSRKGDLPITSVHIGECSGCMINPEMFEQFVVPFASKVADALGPLRFHSCGQSTHLLQAMKKINNLASLDLGGDTSIAKAREVFGHDFPIDIIPMPADLSADSTEPILNWAKNVIEENAGGNLTILYHLEPDYDLKTVRALSDFVKSYR